MPDSFLTSFKAVLVVKSDEPVTLQDAVNWCRIVAPFIMPPAAAGDPFTITLDVSTPEDPPAGEIGIAS